MRAQHEQMILSFSFVRASFWTSLDPAAKDFQAAATLSQNFTFLIRDNNKMTVLEGKSVKHFINVH